MSAYARIRIRPSKTVDGRNLSGSWHTEVSVDGGEEWVELPVTAVDINLKPRDLSRVTFTTIRADVVLEPFSQ